MPKVMIFLRSAKANILNKLILPSLVIGLLVIGHSAAYATDYDGTWFLGFNLRRPPFSDLKVRQAVARAVDAAAIATEVVSGETGGSFIPPGMAGYDPALAPYRNDPAYAAQLLKRAKYAPGDRRLKGLTLLHTDGLKTVEIARRIQRELKALGIQVKLVEVSYRDTADWDKELRSGRHQLFLMGYKPDLLTAESSALLEPLFRSGGAANFTGYANPAVDMALDQLSVINPALVGEREFKLREIDRTLYRELPVLVLFYIEKL